VNGFFMLDPSTTDLSKCAYVMQTYGEIQQQSLAPAFDYTYGAGLWSIAFSMVVGLFVISRYAGVILDFIRRG
jgi:roadblock/LC7 domain-containing protein